MKNKKNFISKLLICMIFILIVIVGVVVYLLLKQNNSIDIDNNEIIQKEENNIINVTNSNDVTENIVNDKDVAINKNTNLVNKLIKSVDTDTYFLLKNCMQAYYENGSFLEIEEEGPDEIEENIEINPVDNLWFYIDEEAKRLLNVNQDNINSLRTWKNYSQFCIDDIYGQSLENNKELYVVYHRIQSENDGNISRVIFIKIDRINNTFSIYPYEYLQIKNYTNLKENDIVELNDIKNIEKNEGNSYSIFDIKANALTCTVELFEKYKFDLYYDLQHLYAKINKKYKQMYFETFDEFKNYIEQNKDVFVTDELSKYSTSDNSTYIEYTGTGESGRNYIFNAKNMTNYEIMLDNYSIETPDYLNGYQYAMYGVKCGYCIDRVILAINEKNYKFVYEKLNTAQKSNYYPNYDVFEKFIKENFYEKNKFEIQGNEKFISSEIYEFKIKVMNMNDAREEKIFTMVVHLKEKGDFEISIVKS